jgi:hypothetical protein
MTEKDQRRNWMGRMEQLRQRMGCGAGKRYFFSGAFAIAEGKKCRHASYAKQTAFHLSHFSSSLLVINKKKQRRKKEAIYIIDIYIFRFPCSQIYLYFTRYRRENSWISRSPESIPASSLSVKPSSSPPLSINPPATESLLLRSALGSR